MTVLLRRESPAHAVSAEAEGGYQSSFADLMVGLLFVFVILVVVLALQQREQLALIGRLISGSDPRGSVTEGLGKGIAAQLPGVQVNPESGVIRLPSDVLFALGSSQLSAEGQRALKVAVQQLERALPCYVRSHKSTPRCQGINPDGHEIETIFIEGHTDNVPMNRAGYDNYNLSLDRARAVERALVSGSDLANYRNGSQQPLFSFSAYADSRPIDALDKGDPRNRRVDLRIVLTYRPLTTLLPELAELTPR